MLWESGCTYVDNCNSFTYQSGDIDNGLFLVDGLHFSAQGTRKLIKNLKLEAVSAISAGKLDIAATRKSGHQHSSPSFTAGAMAGISAADPTPGGAGNALPPHQFRQGNDGPRTSGAHQSRGRLHDPLGAQAHRGAWWNDHHWPPRFSDLDDRPEQRWHQPWLNRQTNQWHQERHCSFCGEYHHDRMNCKHNQPLLC